MSVSPKKRSASDAHLPYHSRPAKSARMGVSKVRLDSDPNSRSGRLASVSYTREEESGLAAKWFEMGRLGYSTVCAFGGAVCATVAATKDLVWRGLFAFGDDGEPSLPTHRPKHKKSISASPSIPEAKPSRSSTPKPPPERLNRAPTNILASSSSSAPSYPTSQSSLASSSNSPASSANGTHPTSTQTSLPTSPQNSQASYDPYRTDAVRKMISRTNQNGLRTAGGVLKTYKRKSHIYEARHRERVKDFLQRVLYERTRAMGYQSDFETFKGYVQYRRRLEELQNISRGGSRAATPVMERIDDMDFLQRAMEKASKSLQSPRPPKPFNPALEELTSRTKSRNERIQSLLHPKRKPIPDRLSSDAEKEVRALLRKRGVVSKAGREQVSDTDLGRLMPGQWLNDEIINFYGQLIVDRVAEAEAGKENESGKVWNVHYFSTFFWPKLQSGYEKGRLAKWTKKVDIFSKDIIIMAINHGNAHWTSAAIDFKRKRIISHDSMGFCRTEVYQALRMYLNEEHKNKKKKPFDFTGWEDYQSDTYPEQENGYDCGVFTCQTLEYLSRGEEEFNFTQRHMPYLRQRMMWEIGRARLADPL